MVTVEFDFMGEAVRLALVAGEYVGGGLAVLLLDATDPYSDGYMAEWGVLTANVPAAAEWCRARGAPRGARGRRRGSDGRPLDGVRDGSLPAGHGRRHARAGGGRGYSAPTV